MTSYGLVSKVFQKINKVKNPSIITCRDKYRVHEYPLRLDIGLTNACNHKCVMCPNPIMKRQKGIMSKELFLDIVRDAKEHGMKSIALGLFGEPTLHPELKSFIEILHENGFSIKMSSNCTMLTKEIADTLINKLTRVHCSFYSVDKKSYEIIQGNHEYEKTVNNIKYLMNAAKGSKTQVKLNFIPMIHNNGDFNKFKSIFEDSLNENIVFGKVRLSNWEKIYEHDNNELRPEKVLPVLRFYRPCDYLNDRLSIDWNGDVMACCMSWDDKQLALGNIKDSSIQEIWFGQLRKKLQERMLDGSALEIGTCRNCDSMRYEKKII